MNRIIQARRSIILAADVSTLDELAGLANAMIGVDGVGGVKLGFTLAMQGLKEAVGIVRESLGNVPIIYDHQKAGNDIPAMGGQFAAALKEAGVDVAILFPFTGTATQTAWTKFCFEAGLDVITGGVMTHPNFLVSEGGYIADESVERIYLLACDLGGRHFVVPGNKINWVTRIRQLLIGELGEDNFVLYAPGFVTQKGDISECGLAAGNEWHAIVGSGIYKQPSADEQRQAAIKLAGQITN